MLLAEAWDPAKTYLSFSFPPENQKTKIYSFYFPFTITSTTALLQDLISPYRDHWTSLKEKSLYVFALSFFHFIFKPLSVWFFILWPKNFHCFSTPFKKMAENTSVLFRFSMI